MAHGRPVLSPTDQTAVPFQYPPTRRAPDVDYYHGTAVPDPYRWLENVDTPETREWIAAQNRVTFAFLDAIPQRPGIRRRLSEIWNYARFGVPFCRGGRWFFFKNDGLQNHAVLYHADTLDGAPAPLLDPNGLSADGSMSVSIAAVSEDGRHLAYAVAVSGSDWNEIRVRVVASGKDLSDSLAWVKFSAIAWTHDGEGFFYSRYPAPTPGGDPLLEVNKGHRLYYHRLGTPQADDRLVFAKPEEPDWGVAGEVSEDGRYLLLSIWLGTDRRNRIYYADLGEGPHPDLSAPIVPLLDGFDAAYGFLGNDGPVFYFTTDRDAPRRRVAALDTRGPSSWRTIVPEQDDVLEGALLTGDTIVASYLHDASSLLRTFGLDGAPRAAIALPGLGTVGELSGKRKDDEISFVFTSFLTPAAILRHHVARGVTTVWRTPAVPFDPAPYETQQVFVRSGDGTRIPLFLTGRRDRPRDGTTPVYLYGYGGFNINMTPAFSPGIVAWLELGGLFAMPVLRGGGEYGEAWHEAGMLAKKQNVFDDFIAAAEWLIAEGVTVPSRLAIGGGSNGGLLVGAAMTQRPDLFGAALPAVGVLDMLRFHRFTIGWAWVPEYGSAEDPALFPTLFGYSPLHRLRAGTRYPATLVTTADHDDRVVPGHSFKFAAALQAAQEPGSPNPVLIRIETKAGHGAGKPTAKVIDEQADRWAFLVRIFGMTVAPSN
jgi:prolyl oligopeptidase